MLKHLEITSHRVRQFCEELQRQIYTDSRVLPTKVCSVPDRIPFREAIQGSFRPALEGERFSPRWSTHWFELDVAIPPEWRDREVHLRFQSVSEGMLWSAEGRALQGLVSCDWDQLLDIRSHHCLTRKALGDEHQTYYVEVSLTGLMGYGINTSPAETSMGGVGELKMSRIAVFDREAWDLYHDLHVIDMLARQLPEKHQLRARAIAAGNAIVNATDRMDSSTWPRARQIAARFYEENAGSRRYSVTAIGHSHIDTAWLWTLAECIRKCARNFTAQLHLLENYPEHVFACSQAQQLSWIRDLYPDIFADVQVEAGANRFVPVGGTWVEPDCNLPSGESLVRQFLLGQRFYEKEFGRRCEEFWNPDVFGYSAAMPQIMRGAGIQFFLTQKLSWNQFNKPVSTTFLWEGIDGTQILTHFPPADSYNSKAEPGELHFAMENHKDPERSTEGLFLFGHGDGGGGPSDLMLENLRRLKDLDGMPSVKIRSPAEFFERLEKDTQDPLVWSGELYFELHRGTYTTMAANKRDNRRSEEGLHDSEFLSAIAHAKGVRAYPHERLTRAWELTCLNQFHDIIPGSSIHEVYQDSAKDYAEILSTVGALRDEACDALWPTVQSSGSGVLTFNSLSFDRQEVVETGEGARIVGAPSLGFRVAASEALAPAEALAAAGLQPVSVTQKGSGFLLSNQLVSAEIDADGHVVSFRDLRMDRECLVPGAKGNQFVLFDDRPLFWEAWDVDIYHLETKLDIGKVTRIAIDLESPLICKIRVEIALTETSALTQSIILRAGSPVLEFDSICDWHEERKFLKVEFPLALRCDHATYEIQFGHVRRPTHFNTSWDWARFEVCAHRWADLSETHFGVALLNDCKYGYSCHGNVMRLSLLRASTWPDPHADRGQHTFRYGLYPHAGGPQTGGVIPAAAAFNQPLTVRPSSLSVGESQSYFSSDNDSIVIDTVKKSEDSDALIVRLFESHGSRAMAQLRTSLPIRSAVQVNLLEDEESPLDVTDRAITLEVRPFEIRSIKVTLCKD